MQQTIIYDAEVFKYNWLMGFKILETQEIIQIWDDFKILRNFYEQHKGDFFISFNGTYYDDIILETLLKEKDPFPISCQLIDENKQMYARLQLNRLDIMEGMAVGTSLKTIESELGMSIEESEIDFMLDRPLTEEEKELTNKYNGHDLAATERLLHHRWSNFVKTKIDLIRYFKLPSSLMRKPFATMVATGLGAKRKNHPPRHFEWYPTLQINNPEIRDYIINEKFLQSGLKFEIAGVEHRMGLGGLHGARENYQCTYFWKVDVKGYYSLIQMNLGLLSRSLPPEGKEAYRRLYDDRLERKKKKDPSADSLKAAILSVWGATLNEYQLLSDITTGNLIMITGQAYIIDLLEKLEPYSELIQTNTDGVFITPFEDMEDKCKEAINEWVKRTGFEVEIDEGSKLFQKDVNNYVCLIDNGKDGEIVAKGGYVNLYKMQDDPKFFEFRLTYNQSQGTIIDKAVVNYFIYDIPVEETVNKEMNPKSFQFTIKKGARSYSHVEVHSYNKLTGETEIKRVGKVNRVFASKDSNFDRRIYKIKNGTPNIFSNMDINIFVFNKDLAEFGEEQFAILDREYYIQQAKNRIADYLTVKEKKEKKEKDIRVKGKIYSKEKAKELEDYAVDETVQYILNHENGLFRVGDFKVNRIGNWFTFVEKKGKTTVLQAEKVTPEAFNLSCGTLQKQKIKIDKQRYIEVFERTIDTQVCYVDKKNADECFDFVTNTFEEALAQLKEFGLVSDEQLQKTENTKIKKITAKSKETIRLDDENHITYENYDLGQGAMYEVSWFKNSGLIKKQDVESVDQVLDIVEAWIAEFNGMKNC